jgi:hypothetical protein
MAKGSPRDRQGIAWVDELGGPWLAAAMRSTVVCARIIGFSSASTKAIEPGRDDALGGPIEAASPFVCH